MAKTEDLKYIAMLIGYDLQPEPMDSIAATTTNDFDLQWVVAELKMRGNITPKAIKSTINRAPKAPREFCGQCKKGLINIVDRHILKSMDNAGTNIDFPIMIPKATTSCPSCGKGKEHTLKLLFEKMSSTELAWTWVVLYDYQVYHMGNVIPYNEFNISDYWPELNFIPDLNIRQIDILTQTYNSATQRTPNLKPAHEIIQQAVQQTAIPF